LDRKIKSLEDEINKVHDENDGLARERQKLMVHIRNLETDRDEAINARRSMDEQLNVER
jgi:cell division protein FtsB